MSNPDLLRTQERSAFYAQEQLGPCGRGGTEER
jgi:hypothetical protein